MNDEINVIDDLIARAAQIEQEKNGRALTEDEVRTLRAVAFLRKIAPYAFPDRVVTSPDQT